MSSVSYEVAHVLNQRAGRLGIPPATRVFGQRMKVYGELMEHGEVDPHPTVVDEGDELARRCCIVRASAREALEEHAAAEAVRRAGAARSRPMRTFEPLFFFFYRQTTGNGNATTISWTRCFDRTSRSEKLVGAVWWKGILVCQ